MEKIDILKLLIFLMVFIVITLGMILFFIIPNVKSYRANKIIDQRALTHKMRVESVLQEREAEFATLKEQNRRAITAFVHGFSDEGFLQYARNFFDTATLKALEKEDYKQDFTTYALHVRTALKSPVNFYDFLEGLNKFENIIQADFPIHMESNASTIDASFMIRVYEINATR